MSGKIKVLVVDDSVLVRKIITDALQRDPDIEVVGTANNGKTAVFKAYTLDPDVITMDIEMPIMNGLDSLQEIIRTNPKPVIMMSVLTQLGAEHTFKALEYGAVDFIPKPSTMLSMSVDEISELLISKVKYVAKTKINFPVKTKPGFMVPASREKGELRTVFQQKPVEPLSPLPPGLRTKKVVGIGTSTGGPSALMTVFRGFPENFPAPVLVVQHMPEGFTKAFAERLDAGSYLKVKEAEDGDRILPGHGYIAPGHSHITVEKNPSGNLIRLNRGGKVSGHRPSIDVLFNSLNEAYPGDLIAAIMTGMGKDGADGIGCIRKNGGYTIAQNEETSVVYGMNRVAVENGGINEVIPLEEISKKIVEHL
jgi:two-component system, chemotaxis family, protein-glutamate methylesterase/glutaminase